MNKMRDVSSVGMEIIGAFIASLEGKNLNPRTLQEYSADLKHFIGWHEYQGMGSSTNVQIFSFDAITVHELEVYRQAMQDVHLKATTVNRRITSIKLLFEWACRSQRIQYNPAKQLQLATVIKRPPKNMESEDQKRLLDAVRSRGSIRDQAILKLMLHTGIRAGEVCSLKGSDVRLSEKQAAILIGSESRKREIPLNTVCRSILSRYMAASNTMDGYLFPSEKTGGQLTERAIRHLIKKYAALAGIQEVSAYTLRHSFGYKKAEKTPMHQLAHWMGHSNLNTTQTYSREKSKTPEK